MFKGDESMNLIELKKEMPHVLETIFFDKGNYFREQTADSSLVKSFTNNIEAILKREPELSEADWFFLYGILGNLYRINGEVDRAIHILTKALSHAKMDSDSQRIPAFQIRLGEAYKYAGEHHKALELFDDVLKDMDKSNNYFDFALQHKGKCLLEMGEAETAKVCIEEALMIRKDKGDIKLIESTSQVLDSIIKSTR
jgi:tetratricopeptide (TPR) repeat protein